MHEFNGDLLIGGLCLHRVHGELEVEHPLTDSGDWILSGHLHLSQEKERLLELDRQYRLHLEDGRGGTVYFSRISHDYNDELVVAFEPQPRPVAAKAK